MLGKRAKGVCACLANKRLRCCRLTQTLGFQLTVRAVTRIPEEPQKRLPVARILIGAFAIPWANRAAYFRVLSTPAVGLVAVMAAWRFAAMQDIQVLAWQLYFVYGCLFTLFAVTCHRLVLLPPYTQTAGRAEESFRRAIRFFGWLAFVYLICLSVSVLGTMALGTVFLNVGSELSGNGTGGLQLVQVVAKVPATYLLGRLSLVFPATAIDKSVDLRWSWDRTRDNGWRLVVVVGLLPWALSSIVEGFNLAGLSTLGVIFLIIMSVALFVVEIVALSLSFWELGRGPDAELEET